MQHTQEGIVKTCKERGVHLYDLAVEVEMKRSGATKESIISEFEKILDVMKKSATRYLNEDSKTDINMIGGFSHMMTKYNKKGQSYIGDYGIRAIAMAFSTIEVNSTMGKIVAAPTAGASGVLPAALLACQDKFNFDDDTLIKGLLTAGYVGQMIGRYFNFAGAEGGCQAECGSAASMGAAALTMMRGGTPEQCFYAASLAFINIMGLVCDPVAGLVEYPCAFRNTSNVINSMICADMVLAGVNSLLPYEEVLMAANEVGNALPYTLKETSLGGVATSDTGIKVRKQFEGILEERKNKLK